MKSRREEAFMTAEFGAEYTRYQREVKALIPFVL
jgi:protein-S-isoprenylcysteine O-methyltransferase Ste14